MSAAQSAAPELLPIDPPVLPPQPYTLGARIKRRAGELGICIISIGVGICLVLDATIIHPTPFDDIFMGPVVEWTPPQWGWPMAALMLTGGFLWGTGIMRWFEGLKRYWKIKRIGMVLTAAAWIEYGIAALAHPHGIYVVGLIFSGVHTAVAATRLVSSREDERAGQRQHVAVRMAEKGHPTDD